MQFHGISPDFLDFLQLFLGQTASGSQSARGHELFTYSHRTSGPAPAAVPCPCRSASTGPEERDFICILFFRPEYYLWIRAIRKWVSWQHVQTSHVRLHWNSPAVQIRWLMNCNRCFYIIEYKCPKEQKKMKPCKYMWQFSRFVKEYWMEKLNWTKFFQLTDNRQSEMAFAVTFRFHFQLQKGNRFYHFFLQTFNILLSCFSLDKSFHFQRQLVTFVSRHPVQLDVINIWQQKLRHFYHSIK